MKLTNEQVLEIRSLYIDRKESAKSPNVIELARKYNVSQETIRNVAKGHHYKWVR